MQSCQFYIQIIDSETYLESFMQIFSVRVYKSKLKGDPFKNFWILLQALLR